MKLGFVLIIVYVDNEQLGMHIHLAEGTQFFINSHAQ